MSNPFLDNPCYNGGKNCSDRFPGCGGNCQRYKDWKASLEAAKKTIKEQKERLYGGELSPAQKKRLWQQRNVYYKKNYE